MNKHELIRTALAGEIPDRVPYAFWTHFPSIDLDPQKLAEYTCDFYRTYDLDFVKAMPNGMYPVEDFGCVCDYSEIASGGVAKVVETPITCYEDWKCIEPVSITSNALNRELSSLELVLRRLQGEVPVVFTVFSPATIAQKLSKNQFLDHVKHAETDLLHQALQAITETTAALSAKAIELGAAGVFFATQLASHAYMTEEQYREFGAPYDVQVLEAAQEGWFNMVHLHGRDIMFDLLEAYPVQALNWHVWETAPTLAEARQKTEKCLIGGVERDLITRGERQILSEQIQRALRDTGGRKHIVTPGCVIRYPLTEAYMRSFRDVIKTFTVA